jgi:hypothetical protein
MAAGWREEGSGEDAYEEFQALGEDIWPEPADYDLLALRRAQDFLRQVKRSAAEAVRQARAQPDIEQPVRVGAVEAGGVIAHVIADMEDVWVRVVIGPPDRRVMSDAQVWALLTYCFPDGGVREVFDYPAGRRHGHRYFRAAR